MKGIAFILLFSLVLTVANAGLDIIFGGKNYPNSCTAAKPKKNGIYKIQVRGGEIIQVYCDVTLTGSPWLVIQRRTDASVNFYRNWPTYKVGFGDLNHSFFIGLNKLNALTAGKPQELYIHLQDFDGISRYAKYSDFAIGNEDNLFGLNTLGKYKGNAGDGLKQHVNQKFSTFDQNNNFNSSRNLAADYSGAWWYGETQTSNLNGLYLAGKYGNEQLGRGITWSPWRGDQYSYKLVQMMIRPKN